MDLADQIDDYICSFEGLGDITMDSLAIFIFLWAVLALFSLWLCKYLYQKYSKEKEAAGATTPSRQSSVGPGTGKAEKTRLSEPREIQASKTDMKELMLSKPTAAAGAVGAGAARSVKTPTGAPGATSIRRRMVRQSSTGPENIKRRYVPPPSNVVGPETSSVTWTSHVFRWLYSDLVIVNELLMSWVIALNDTLRKTTDEQGIMVEIVRVLPDSPAPGLSNIFCNADENNPADMLITFDCDAMPVLQMKTMRQKSGKFETSHYKVTVSRFRARMANAMNYNSLKGDMRVEGYPDIRIAMNTVGPVKAIDPEDQQFESEAAEILTRALRDTVYPVDFSMFSSCPRAEVEPTDLPVIYPTGFDPMASHPMDSTNQPQSRLMTSANRRLLVKIVNGEDLKEAKNPYVVVEMDEPAQKNQTAAMSGSTPQWNEHFLFDLSSQSAEILFEVYDSPANASDPPKFLGLGLVGIEELAVGPALTQILTLQPRPYETQPVYGNITVDFVFIEGAEVPAFATRPPYKLKEALHISTPAITEHMKNGSNLADAAVRALQEGAFPAATGHPSKSTLIIHSVQRNSKNLSAFKVELNKDGQMEVIDDEVLKATITADDSSSQQQNQQTEQKKKIESKLSTDTTDEIEEIVDDVADTTDGVTESANANEQSAYSAQKTGNDSALGNSITEFGQPNAASSPQNGHNNNMYSYNGATNAAQSTLNNNSNLPRNGDVLNTTTTINATAMTAPGIPANQIDLDERGRSKKRNFFGTLKKRLSRSKTRTHSADRGVLTSHHNNNVATPTGTLNGDSRSLSVDRAVLSKSNSLGRRTGLSPTLDHSRRSSLSESSAISGFSSASTKTYIHEASTLVLETIENGVKRHFIVPLNIAQRPRWRRKGTKLHIYNDHTFIAKHLSGSGLQCSICMKSIPRRPGKQGYECRDCQLICHKQCHIRAPQACPNPTVLSMELTKLNSAAADRSIRKL
ncbi:uncharacterized protein LOC119641413 isoform X7 [Glossina fuscipes]|uniref:Uncharacterized protein LOC119641413 isoform X7 n=1 Tax=Glossina fuscipes TaxID=7396 RepID=A0A9C5ZCB3_9MUSC|nr:uncharacterized protein LOC119641413 isoform X7 [Glossina fuscipes]